MVCLARRSHLHCLLPLLLFFSISGYGRGVATNPPASGTQNGFSLYLPESSWLLGDLDGDHTPDFAGGQRLSRTKDGYSYRVQLHLSSDAPSTSFTVFHSNGLGLKITGVDIDGDDDIDLIISDRFFPQHVGVWLNDGTGRFVKSLPGRFSPNSSSDLGFAAVDFNWAGRLTVDKQQRRLPHCLPGIGYIKLLLLKSSALNRHPVEWLFPFATDLLRQRAPPTVVAA